MLPSRPDLNPTMLILYTGESFSLTQLRSYFIYYVNANITVKDVTKINQVIGIITAIKNFVDVNGTNCGCTTIIGYAKGGD